MENKEDHNTGKRSSWIIRRILKIGAITLAALLLIVAALLTAVVIALSPERLTRIVTRYSPDYIDGTLTASRIELTFWSTFPRLSVDIDSLTLVSNAFNGLDPELRHQLPANADTLLTLRSLHGGLNLASLLAGRYELYDVAVSQPSVNIVVANDSTANYNLTPESSDSTDPLPSISINRFLILNSGPLRYFSLPDSTDFSLSLKAVDANGADSPLYSLSTEGDMRIAGLTLSPSTPMLFTADGHIHWNPSIPSEIELRSFLISVDGTQASLDTRINFSDTLTIDHLDLSLPSVDITRVAGYLPAGALEDIGGFDTNMNVALAFHLSQPYVLLPDTTTIPSGQLSLKISPCHLSINRPSLKFDQISLETQIDIDGNNLDRSVIDISDLSVKSRALEFDFSGSVKRPVSDPLLTGQLRGRAFTAALPSYISDAIGGKIAGTIGTNLKVRLRQSDLQPNRFHRIFARGTISLRHFDFAMPSASVPSDTMRLTTPAAFLKFDSGKKIEINGVTADSLLTVSITADTITYSGSGLTLFARNLETGLGSRNVHSSADTTRINPFGGRIKADMLRIESLPDSMKVAFSNFDGNASLRRFEGLDSIPLLSFAVGSSGIALTSPDMGLAIWEPKLDISAHINALIPDTTSINRNHANPTAHRHRAATDSVADDSIMAAGLRRLINRWKITGSLSATRGRLLSRSFPLPTRINDVDLAFSSDSITLHSLELKIGRTDLKVKGDITNLEKWASRRRRSARRPMRIGVTVTADTIDIDQLSAATMSSTPPPVTEIALTDDTITAMLPVEATERPDAAEEPFTIPINLEALFDVKARNVIYSGLLLHNFSGELETRAGIMRLRDLSAASDVGQIDVSALYSSLNPDSLEFGMGMRLSRFHIDRFLQVMPAIDSLLPAMRDLSGIIDADVAATTRLDRDMNFIIPSLKAVIGIDGDSLVLLDDETFRSMSKWLVFKNKKRNLIDHMSVKIDVDSSFMTIYPFIFDIDRYRLGVMGTNDLDMHLNYHVSVLKSPLPFKFGINITGTPDDMKIRLGGAKVKENGEGAVEQLAIADTTRINLISQFESLFRRGIGASRSSFTTAGRRLEPITIDSTYTDLPDSILSTLTDSLPH